MKRVSAYVTIFLSLLLAGARGSAVNAQTGIPYDCVTGGEVCSLVYSEHWEFNAKRGGCYQPFAQCGGTRFDSKEACERACAHLQPLPTSSTTPTVSPFPSNIPSAAPTDSPTITLAVTPTLSPSCPQQTPDINGDGAITIADFEVWRQEFSGERTTKTTDLNCDGKVSLADFELWRQAFT